ncbi:MAG: hypothetical protein IJ158_09190 [Treponema sp.]|nr:hypothetical protein [Treponema sp.]
MTVGQFADLVKCMRAAQVKYFKTRAPSDLAVCKSLEKQVDAALADREKNMLDRVQPKLF